MGTTEAACSVIAGLACAAALLGFVLARHNALKLQRAEDAREGLQDELWELKSAAAALNRAEAASEAKSRFLATVSHEFRTPLNGIVGMTDLLAETSHNAEQGAYISAIRASAVALSSLINEILDFSRIEAGKLELAVEPFDLPALVEGVVELLAPKAQDKGLEIASTIASKLPRMVVGDAGRLRQVLLNLAGNAVKFTEKGGVGLRVEATAAGAVRFSVADTGPGVAFDRRQAIFQDFEQADGTASRQHEGTGLGLAISRRLIALMGGELRLEQSGPKGSVFAFEAPLPAARPDSPRESRKDLAGKKALIVAASPFGGSFLGERLGEYGAEVVRVDGEAAALAILTQTATAPDMVIVDCALGEAATQNLAKVARAVGAAKTLVLFSPFERRTFGEAAAKGFDGWLVKPVRLESLHARLESKLIAQRRDRETAAAPKPWRHLAGLHILLAEDNEVNALLVERRLSRLGAKVARARDGMEAVALAQSAMAGANGRFDAILMDIRMPGQDGLAAARKIRAEEARLRARPVRMIALTANAFDEDRAAAQLAGMDAFLTKPVDFHALAAAIINQTTMPPS